MRKLIPIILIFSLATLYAATINFDQLKARPDGDNIIVEWSVQEESGVSEYEVQRASANGLFKNIGDEDPRGDGHLYRFVDVEAFIKNPKGSKGSRTHEEIDYKYRILVKLDNGTSKYSDNITVTHKISSVKRTWGMIKELFR